MSGEKASPRDSAGGAGGMFYTWSSQSDVGSHTGSTQPALTGTLSDTVCDIVTVSTAHLGQDHLLEESKRVCEAVALPCSPCLRKPFRKFPFHRWVLAPTSGVLCPPSGIDLLHPPLPAE